MKAFLLQLHNVVDIGFVGGASYAKHQDQLGVDRFRAFLVAPLLHILNVLVLPAVQRNGADERDVNTQITVDTRTTDADEAAQSGRSPTRTYEHQTPRQTRDYPLLCSRRTPYCNPSSEGPPESSYEKP